MIINLIKTVPETSNLSFARQGLGCGTKTKFFLLTLLT